MRLRRFFLSQYQSFVLTRVSLKNDCGKFLSKYQESGIFESDPFIRIVEDSVGKLVADAILDAKTANKSIKTGVCGEHGADPKSVDFFDFFICLGFLLIFINTLYL